MIRRALNLEKYEPSIPEVERVKEEFDRIEVDCNTNRHLKKSR